MIHRSARMAMLPGALGACLMTGTEKIRCGYGNGDCLLLDFRHGLFAVADATERHPSSSSRLLMRMTLSLKEKEQPLTGEEWEEFIDEMYSLQEYREKTTLSCVIFHENGNGGMRCVVFSGGDSTITAADSNRGIFYRTRSNMNFAGRSKNAGNVNVFDIYDENTRVFIYTDGLDDLIKLAPGIDPGSGLPGFFFTERIDCLAEMVKCEMEAAGSVEHDDIAFIALMPFAVKDADLDPVIMGGTTPAEETRFRQCPVDDIGDYVDAKDFLNKDSFEGNAGLIIRV